MTDLVSSIIKYEDGELSDKEMVELFSGLVKSGQVWSLQGHYGRTAACLIENGVLDKTGEIDYDRLDEILKN